MAIIIRLIEPEDIDKGFLEALENLLPADIGKEQSKEILQEIKSNPLHKIFVAEEKGEVEEKQDENNDENATKASAIIVGTTTLLIEPKFINKGMRVGYIEDVSVRKEYEGLGIGSQLITYATNAAISVEGCRKVLLYCSENTKPFYEKLGYKLANDTFVMKYDP